MGFAAWKAEVVEPAVGFGAGLRNLGRSTTVSTVGTGLAAALFGCSGPALIIYEAGRQGNWPDPEIASWIFAVYFFGGLLGIGLALRWMKPMAGAWTIPGAAMLAGTLQYYSIDEAVGAFLVAGVLVLAIGLTGQLSRLLRSIPAPIMLAMITGALFRFGTGMIDAVTKSFATVAPAFLAYVVVEAVKSRGRLTRIPASLVAIAVGFAAAAITGNLGLGGVQLKFADPIFHAPAFSISSILSIAVPIALMVIFAENVQGIGILMAQGYDDIPSKTRVPINSIAILSGVGGIITSFFGGHNANLAGPMTAMDSSPESHVDPAKRYAAAFWTGVLFMGFGLIAPSAVSVIGVLPKSLIAFIAGVTMVGVLLGGLRGAFGAEAGGRYQIGAFFAFVTAASGITVFRIGAPFWALVIGCVVSLAVETRDWTRRGEPPVDKARPGA